MDLSLPNLSTDFVLNIAQQIITYGLINSILVYGIIETIKAWIDENPDDDNTPKVHRYIKIVITYVLGFAWAPLIQGVPLLWVKFILGFFVASTSVAAYKVSINGFLTLVPAFFDYLKGRLTGGTIAPPTPPDAPAVTTTATVTVTDAPQGIPPLPQTPGVPTPPPASTGSELLAMATEWAKNKMAPPPAAPATPAPQVPPTPPTGK